jgi:hypothetical protein
MAAMIHQYPTEKHLLINPLDWIAYRRAWYPLGHEGVEVMPGYMIPAQVATINARLPAHIQGVVFPPLGTTLADYYYGLNSEEWLTIDEQGVATQALAADRVWLMAYDPAGITLEDVGTIKQGTLLTPTSYQANFGGVIFLGTSQAQRQGQKLQLTLAWKYLGPDPNATIFRHVLDCAGNLLGQGDGHVLGRAIPFALLPAGAEIRDVRTIPLSTLAADGCYRIEVGLFHPDGQRMQPLTPQGVPFENSAAPLVFKL